jgi:hypothetical protein
VFIASFTHDPDAVLDYGLDWSKWLTSGDDLDSATWTIPDGLTEDTSAIVGKVATVWIRGGTAGESYLLTCHVVTTGGREDDRSIQLVCRDR